MTAQPRPSRRGAKRRREQTVTPLPTEGFTRDELDSDDSAPKEPHFEVDDLDSTDDEQLDAQQDANASQQFLGLTDAVFASDNDDDDPDFELASAQPLPSPPSSPTPEPLPFTLAHFASEDEEDDPDFDVHFPLESVHPSIQAQDTLQSSEDSPSSPHHDMTYAQFLQALNFTAPTEPQSVPDPFSQLLDDDDEFDYMREAANVRDDPLEFRQDLPVSRREVAQLLSERDIALRRQKRQRTSRAASAATAPSIPMLFPPSIMSVPSASRPVPSVAPVVPVIPATPTAHIPPVTSVTIASPAASVIGQKAAAATQMQQQALLPGAVASLSPICLSQFHHQLKAFVQILTHTHANSAKSVRMSSGEQVDPVAKNVLDKSETMLRRVVENRNISLSYHAMLETHIMHIARFSEGLAFRQFEECFTKQNRRKSVYAIEGLAAIETFLSDCQTIAIDQMPNGALERMDKVSEPHLKQALVTRKRQFTLSGARKGWYTWTAEDDRLLAMTIAKYGREVAEYSKDLLPHRLDEDCQARVRHLCSRRCTDNAVKRQMMLISAPLTQQEVKLVQHGLSVFGGAVEDEEVWKKISKRSAPWKTVVIATETLDVEGGKETNEGKVPRKSESEEEGYEERVAEEFRRGGWWMI
ncbi:Homeobox-like protein [Gracilaria domingensis]|nr:Homeobox-like protein [Gracilaria domingensis]